MLNFRASTSIELHCALPRADESRGICRGGGLPLPLCLLRPSTAHASTAPAVPAPVRSAVVPHPRRERRLGSLCAFQILAAGRLGRGTSFTMWVDFTYS